MRVVCGVRMDVALGSVGTRGEVVVSSGGSVSVADGGELDGGIVAGSPMELPESSRKTSHTVSHSSSISAMSFCSLAWKEEVVKLMRHL